VARVEAEAAADWVAGVVPLLPGREAIVCVRNAVTRNHIKLELPVFKENVRSVVPQWPGNRLEIKGKKVNICKEGTIMPRGDGTGPLGAGPMSGRGAGFCSWFGMPDYGNAPPAYGYGMGFGRGGCRGWRNRFFARGFLGWMRPRGYAAPYQKPDPELEKQMLKNEADTLRSEMDYIKKRLDELESGKAVE